jgi:hypothetical protein
MKRSAFAQGCCTTPSAIWFWGASFVVFFGISLLLGRIWPHLQQYGDTTILVALAAACFVNFGRNRTLHCGLTGPLFLVGAVVALLIEAGIWTVDPDVLWGIVLTGVALAFLIEWRTVGRQRGGSAA